MPDNFIEREAKFVANAVDCIDPQRTANILRQNCQDMTPGQFTSLVLKTARMEDNGGLADLHIQRDGDVVLHGRDGRRYNAGRIPVEEACRIVPLPPVVIVERPRHEPPRRQPDVIIIDRDRDRDRDRDHRHDPHPPRGIYDRPLPRQDNSGLEMVIGGAVLGAGVSKKGDEVKGAAAGAGGALLLKGILDATQDKR